MNKSYSDSDNLSPDYLHDMCEPTHKPKPKPRKARHIAPPKKVLIVDDDPMAAQDVSEILAFSRQISYEPILADRGDEALRQYEAHQDIAIIILDTEFPGTDEFGWQIYDRLREAGYRGSALARSGRGNRPEWQERSVEFLDKAASPEKLEATVNRLIGTYKGSSKEYYPPHAQPLPPEVLQRRYPKEFAEASDAALREAAEEAIHQRNLPRGESWRPRPPATGGTPENPA